MGFAEDESRKHFLALNIFSRAVKGKTDNDILRRVTSPTAAWKILVGSYNATTRGATLQRMEELTNRRVKPGSNNRTRNEETLQFKRTFLLSPLGY